MAKKLKIGLFGFGCVGQGLYHVLNNSTGFKADIVKIAVKDKNKTRSISNDLITYDKSEILDNPEIDVIVELINDADEAFRIVSEALKKGKHVVTANKKMLALHLEELYDLQQKSGVSLLYEGAAAGSIPIIRTIEEYFDNEELEGVSGIINGTTNYILSKVTSEKLSYPVALEQAQKNGFAESDPVSDVEGYDAQYKTIIIALHAFGLIIAPEKIFTIGITTLNNHDIQYAAEKGYKIKLTALIQRLNNNSIAAIVAPRFVSASNCLFNVENEFNGVIIAGKFSGDQFLQGRGAGSLPTGAAVLSDISALSHGYKYEYKKHKQQHASGCSNNVLITVYLRYNSTADLDVLQFKKIHEQYTGGEYNYVVGEINLQNLLDHKNYITSNKLFISLVHDNIKSSEQTADKTQVNQKELITI